jgi:hypothetical protein
LDQIEARDRGWYERLESLAAKVHARFPLAPYTQRFIAFLRARPSREDADVEEAFLRHELHAFIERPDTDAQERDAQLTKLAIPHDVCARIYELCFIPGIVFEWCTTITHRSAHAYKEALKEQRRLRSICNRIQHERLLSATLKAEVQWEADIVIEFLQLQYPAPHEVQEWQKQLGIDKQLHIETQKQGLWSLIFEDLVDLIIPFCSGPKHAYLKETPTAQPYETFVVVSHLMHRSWPDLWPDNSELVRSRYNEAKWKKMNT